MRRRLTRTIAGGAALGFALVACGQKPGIHIDGGGTLGVGADGGIAAPPGAGATATGDPSTTASNEDATLGSGASTGGTGAGPTGTSSGTTTSPSQPSDGGAAAADAGADASAGRPAGDGQAATSGGGGATSGQKRQVRGSDRTGVTDDRFVFASHAPVTGAAPLPTTSFEQSGDLYWRYLTQMKGETVLGRSEVELIFRDDKYDPNSARQVCRELASKAFTVSGGGGTDQIQACGQFAAVAKVPYFSAGVTEAGLKDNAWYFAASMTYKQQGPLLAQMVKKNFGDKRVAAIITDTPNFDDAVAGWEAGVKQQGLDYYKTLRHPKGDTSWYNAFAGDLKANGVEVVFILSSPVDYIRFAQQSEQSSFTPQYVGVGVSMGLNAVLGSGCDYVDGGMFFSPFPGLDYARKNVPEFFQAGQKLGSPTDDIALALWGTSEILHGLLTRYGQTYGNDLTREDFRDLVEAQSGVKSSVFPELSYSPQDHFGSGAVHLLRANCAAGEYETVSSFATAF